MANVNLQGIVPTTPSERQEENYVLHDPNITQNPTYYKELMAGAKQSIRILDPHALTENDASKVFQTVCTENITIEIYTTGYSEDELKIFADNAKKILMQNLHAFSLYVFSFKAFGVGKDQKIFLWHDRYLIIDDSDFYLIGDSLDAQQMSPKYHGIYHLYENKDKKKVADLYKHYKETYNSLRGIKTERHLP